MNDPAAYRLRTKLNGPENNDMATRWAVWLGADTAPRLAAARGVGLDAAWRALRRACQRGAIVLVGYRPAKRGHWSSRYATPDPNEFP